MTEEFKKNNGINEDQLDQVSGGTYEEDLIKCYQAKQDYDKRVMEAYKQDYDEKQAQMEEMYRKDQERKKAYMEALQQQRGW